MADLDPQEVLADWELHFLIDWGHRIHALDREKFSRIERDLLAKLEAAKQDDSLRREDPSRLRDIVADLLPYAVYPTECICQKSHECECGLYEAQRRYHSVVERASRALADEKGSDASRIDTTADALSVEDQSDASQEDE